MINLNRANRKDLIAEDKDFLVKAVALAKTISEWTSTKADFLNRPRNYVSPMLILADILVESEWGKHPLAQSHYNKRYSNNLTLLKVDDLWQGKSQKYEGKEYKAYSDWLHFATDYSDLLTFSARYQPIIKTFDYTEQLKRLANIKSKPKEFQARVNALVDFYVLKDLC